MTGLLDTLKSLETAEDFLEFFEIDYDGRVVDVNRLHILQRLHDRLAEADLDGIEDERLRAIFGDFLSRAYQDFVVSDARTEKVFKVFHRGEPAADTPARTIVPLAAVVGTGRTTPS